MKTNINYENLCKLLHDTCEVEDVNEIGIFNDKISDMILNDFCGSEIKLKYYSKSCIECKLDVIDWEI